MFGNQLIRYSQINESCDKNILLIDCIGKLANAYSYGKIAFIGGGFTGKLHNTLEPVVFGLPVIFGPKHKKFPEAQQFIEAGIGFSIENENDFSSAMKYLEDNLIDIHRKCEREIDTSKGAAEKIVNELN